MTGPALNHSAGEILSGPPLPRPHEHGMSHPITSHPGRCVRRCSARDRPSTGCPTAGASREGRRRDEGARCQQDEQGTTYDITQSSCRHQGLPFVPHAGKVTSHISVHQAEAFSKYAAVAPGHDLKQVLVMDVDVSRSDLSLPSKSPPFIMKCLQRYVHSVSGGTEWCVRSC